MNISQTPVRGALTLLLTLPLLLAGCNERNAAIASAQAQAQAPAAGARSVAIARGKVEVQGGLVELSAPADGLVEAVNVAEGDTVKKGQVLLRLAADAARQDSAVAEAELKAAQARQQAQAVKLPAARQYAARLAEAAAAGGLDRQRADDAQQAARELEAAVAVATAETQVAARKLAQSQALVARLSLGSPVDGSVVRVAVHTGAHLETQSGRTLLVLLPNRPLQVRAELNESFAAAVRTGMSADVSIDSTAGASAAPRRAKVVRVASVMGATRLDDDGSAPRAGQRVVDCFLVFDQAPAAGAQEAGAWRVGQNVRVNFHE
ncbi:HlyD family efflux transporter periplasmic adaptor subunit [Xylophilus rhododendri]|uniref:HlyD family efflux transporter periplasmic adaptor subunit n=1 Tax=Xylophilus rhododendri TaxID=2697032 RepID=A0A857J8N4_9BURK|nr:HlyD family efflux transporter periplasmic adaptor subunit [Xylophilus rhododendri]QHI99583.1 HlyD family efflux transporter periplasmic adaptor subunit [Xylophilus rhododendri]